MKKHISYIILAGAILLALSFGFQVNAQSLPTVTMDKPIQDMTISELQAKIAEILSVIQQLQALIAQLQGGGGGGVSCNFYRNLYPGISGSDVKCLQQYLNNAGHTVANSGPGSPNNETIYYGSLTRAAVKKWQDANNIESGAWWGYFGPKSQAIYNEIAATPGEQEEPPAPPLSGTYCGDNIAQRPSDQGTIEDCDGTDLRNKTCLTQGYTGGTLSCGSDCSFNTSQCAGTGPDIPTPPTPPSTGTSCGDSIMQTPNSEGIYEVCDRTNLGTSTCQTYGYPGGTLSCSSNCITFNTSNCITALAGGGGGGAQTPVGPTCGDNTDNICPSGCTNSQDDDCTYCGDNALQRPNNEGILEVCDNTKLNNETCITKGFSGGTLQCSDTCLTFDTSSCTLPEPPNEAPVLNTIGDKSTNENSTLSFTISATDPDGDELSYSISNRPSGAEFNASTRTLTWIPTYEQQGTYNTTFTVSDGSLTDTETITITVNNVNRDPTLNPIGDKAVQQNNTLSFTISGSDPDNDTLIYTASVLSGASFNASTRIFSWTPSNTGTYNTTFAVSDGSLTDTETIFITVTSAPQPNNAPVANNQSIFLSEDNSINITLSATDLDGDPLTYAIVSNPSNGALSGTAPSITYIPNTNYNGSDSFTFRANDGQEDSNTATISLTINPINDAPVLNSVSNKTIDENSLLTFTISGTDLDGDALYYSIQDSPSGATFNASTRTFTWTPSYTQAGTYDVTFIVSDAEYADQETITITVNDIETGPVCGDSICEGTETCSTCSADCGACPAGFPTDYIAYWKFDSETGGITPDKVGNNAGTLVGDAQIVSDVERGNVLSLDGSGDYVSLGGTDLYSNRNSFSISIWFWVPADLSSTQTLFKQRYSSSNKSVINIYWYNPASNDLIRFVVRNSSDSVVYADATGVSKGAWHHLIGVYNGSIAQIYIDTIGKDTTPPSLSPPTKSGSGDTVIGSSSAGSPSSYSSYWNGTIDDVMIYDRALSEAEILQIYNSQSQNECQQNSDCNDNNDCTINTCVGSGGAGADSRGCAVSFVNSGTSCDDGLYCTENTACNGAGSCAGGTANTCSDAVVCTDDSCNEVSDTCENTANDSSCNAGYVCDTFLGCVADPCFGIDFCSNYTDSGNCSANACGVSGPGCEWNVSVCEEMDVSAWTRPIGIPYPSFGIDETHMMYAGLYYEAGGFNYKDAGNGPYTHYIDSTHPGATDSGNPYGTASLPRKIIPTNIAEGSVVEIHNSVSGTGTLRITANGSADKPVFVRGYSFADMPLVQRAIRINGAYSIWENLELNYLGKFWIAPPGNAHHVAIRNNEVYGNRATTDSHAITIYGESGNLFHDIVVYNNHLHHRGNSEIVPQNDIMGVAVGGSQDIWILDNHIHHNGGDSIQLNGPNRVYIGRNTMHDDRENAVDIKYMNNAVVSENKMYGYHTNPGAEGAAVVIHYNPNNVNILFNEIYDSVYGISGGATDFNVVGNIIHDCGRGMGYNSVGDTFVVNNVFYNCGKGISASGSEPTMIVNNIISDISGYHLVVNGVLEDASDAMSNLFYQPGGGVDIDWNGIYNNVADFQVGTGKCVGCIEADPQFLSTDSLSPDFLRPDSTSPAIDNGILDDVYATFYSLYGIDLKKDIEGRTRPQGAEWDIGAYEYGPPPARISQTDDTTDEKLNNLASVLSSIQSAVQDILKRIQELF